MLEQVDLDRRLSKSEFEQQLPDLKERLYDAQKSAWDAGIPVVVLFEGWDAAGKGTAIRLLSAAMDPRGFAIRPIRAARGHERRRPWLWRFWQDLPARGQWAIFDRSWYGRVLVERVEGLATRKQWRQAYRDIVDFERTLADEGTLFVKLWLHISKKEQKRRFKKLLEDPLTAWHVTDEDWRHHEQYDEYLRAIEEMLAETSTEWAPWTIVEATDRHFARAKVVSTILATVEEGVARARRLRQEAPTVTAGAIAAPSASSAVSPPVAPSTAATPSQP